MASRANYAQFMTEMTSIAQVIPQDIIRGIFVQVAGVQPLETLRALWPAEFPWYLGRICSRWRTALLSIGPRKLFVVIDPDTAESITNVVTYFLDLNRGRQFDLILCYYCAAQGCILTNAMSHIFGLLVAESAHWRHVCLRTSHPCVILGRYRLKDHLPSLQSLRFEDITEPCLRVVPFHDGSCRDSFANTPSLTHVKLSLTDWDWKFNWSNLTYLHLAGLKRTGTESILLSLQQAINLNTLVTHTVFTNLTCERIILPRLESWRAYDCHWLSYIKAPTLQNLYVDSIYDNGIDVVTSFLCESGCKLAYLTWDGTKEPSSFSKILRHAPELVHVKVLGNSDIIAASIESLSAPIPPDLAFVSDLPVPQLQSLQVGLMIRGWLTDRIIEGLSKFLFFRNGRAASNGGRPIDRVKWLIVENHVIRDERLRRLCEAFRVELHSPADALEIPSIFDRISRIF